MADNTSPVKNQGPGPELRQARETASRSLGELAAEMHIGVAHLEAIEANQFESLGGRPYVKSYIRAYARSLELDPEPFLQSYEGLGLQGHQWRANDRLDDMDDSRQGAFFGVGLVATALLIAFLFWFMNDDVATPEPLELQSSFNESAASPEAGNSFNLADYSDAVDSADEETPSNLINGEEWVGEATPNTAATTADNEQTDDSESELTESAVDSESPEAVASIEKADAENVETAKEADTKTEESKTEVSKPKPAESVAVNKPVEKAAEKVAAAAKPTKKTVSTSGTGSDTVLLTFKENSWVEVQDGSGKQLIRGLARKGDERSYSGSAPFQVFLGNAPGVGITFNGDVFSTKTYLKSNNTARFALVKP